MCLRFFMPVCLTFLKKRDRVELQSQHKEVKKMGSEEVVCPVCGGKTKIIGKYKGGSDIYECVECGTTTPAPKPGEEKE